MIKCLFLCLLSFRQVKESKRKHSGITSCCAVGESPLEHFEERKSRHSMPLFYFIRLRSGITKKILAGITSCCAVGESPLEHFEERKARPSACFFVFGPFARASSALRLKTKKSEQLL
jgi:hypothetical protein